MALVKGKVDVADDVTGQLLPGATHPVSTFTDGTYDYQGVVTVDTTGAQVVPFVSGGQVSVLGFNGTNSQLARIDSTTRTWQVIDYEHHEIHSGSHYIVSDVVDLAINNVYDVQFTTPNTTAWTHLVFSIDCEAETEWFIYEGATINVAGTAITPRNNNRNSSNTSGNTLAGITNTSVANANADTAVAGATVIEHGIVGAGKTGGSESRSRELILKQNTVYCMRAVANAAGYTDFIVSWYEHTNQAA